LTIPNFILSNLIDISVYSAMTEQFYEISYIFKEEKEVHSDMIKA